MARRKGKRVSPGDAVKLMVRCDQLHLWVINGVIGTDGHTIECGVVTAQGAPDDPTCCPICRQPFTASYGMF